MGEKRMRLARYPQNRATPRHTARFNNRPSWCIIPSVVEVANDDKSGLLAGDQRDINVLAEQPGFLKQQSTRIRGSGGLNIARLSNWPAEASRPRGCQAWRTRPDSGRLLRRAKGTLTASAAFSGLGILFGVRYPGRCPGLYSLGLSARIISVSILLRSEATEDRSVVEISFRFCTARLASIDFDESNSGT